MPEHERLRGEGTAVERKVAVVTELLDSLPQGGVEELAIRVPPMSFSYAGEDYLDGVGLTPEEFYGKMDPEATTSE